MIARLIFPLILAASAGGIYAAQSTPTGQAYMATVYALVTADREALFASETPEDAIALIRSRYEAVGGEPAGAEQDARPTARDFSQRNLTAPPASSTFGKSAATAPRAKEFSLSE